MCQFDIELNYLYDGQQGVQGFEYQAKEQIFISKTRWKELNKLIIQAHALCFKV